MLTDEFDSIFNSGESTPKGQEDSDTPSITVGARLAFVDLNFSWPPNGGADTDLYNILVGLQELGYTIHLFVLHEKGSSDRGRVSPDKLPFPTTRLDFSRKEMTHQKISHAFREAVDAWHPNLVFVQHGFALKPYVLEALQHHKTVARYYAHELACARDTLRFMNGAPCPKDYLRTPDQCRACSVEHQRGAIESGNLLTWNVDFLAAQAYRSSYYEVMCSSLSHTNAIIVSNADMKSHLDGFHDNVFILPGGVHVEAVPMQEPLKKDKTKIKTIFMAGRADDPLKGLQVLLDAGKSLAEHRTDFAVWATHFDHTLSNQWFKALGWKDHSDVLSLYAQCDIAVVPSVWDEPFGLVAVEAMAAGRPVCASQVGGLQEIVSHGETGYLHPRGDAATLAKQLDHLLNDQDLRVRMGEAGRKRVEAQYDWQGIIATRYTPIIEGLLHDEH